MIRFGNGSSWHAYKVFLNGNKFPTVDTRAHYGWCSCIGNHQAIGIESIRLQLLSATQGPMILAGLVEHFPCIYEQCVSDYALMHCYCVLVSH